MSSLTITPEPIAVTPKSEMVTSPVSATEVKTPALL